MAKNFPGFSDYDMKRIRAIACQIVEGMVIDGKLNPDDPEAIKKAVIQAGCDAKQAYAAALEYVSG